MGDFQKEMEVYHSSHRKLAFIGEQGLQLLQQTSVLVVGAGGLGCPCLLALTGAGFGKIGIVDFDTVSISNLHRQSLYNVEDVGHEKIAAAFKRLATYNPSVNFFTYNDTINADNVLDYLLPFDIIVDATDNFETRYLVNDACVVLNKPLVYGAIHQHEGHITVFNYNGSGTLRCLFPNENNEHTQSCAVIGAYNIITSIIGNMMANEAIKLAIQQQDVLANQLLQLDVLNYNMLKLRYSPVDANRLISQQALNSATTLTVITQETLQMKTQQGVILQMVDVRTAAERETFHLGGIHLPLAEIEAGQLPPYTKDTTLVTYCQTGKRSAAAAKMLREAGFTTVYNLRGGIEQWKQQMGNEVEDVP